jgi:hypothetical protein
VDVKDIIAQADKLIGQTVETQGDFIILQNGNDFLAYLFSPESSHEDEPQQIIIAHSLSELKAFMRPLASMQLIYRGRLRNPPYLWRFAIQMTASLDMDADNQPIFTNIEAVRFQAAYAENFSELMPDEHYLYQAQVDYDYDPEQLSQHNARAIIKTQRRLCFTNDESEVIVLQADDNRYARLLLKRKVKIQGWLRYLPDREIGRHFLLRTSAIRSSMLGVGLLKGLTSIWWRPSPYYQVLRAHMPINRGEEVNLQVEITGTIEYLQSEEAPHIQGGTQAKLVFTEIDEIIIHDEIFLRYSE